MADYLVHESPEANGEAVSELWKVEDGAESLTCVLVGGKASLDSADDVCRRVRVKSRSRILKDRCPSASAAVAVRWVHWRACLLEGEDVDRVGEQPIAGHCQDKHDSVAGADFEHWPGSSRGEVFLCHGTNGRRREGSEGARREVGCGG